MPWQRCSEGQNFFLLNFLFHTITIESAAFSFVWFCSKLKKREEQMEKNFVLFFRKHFQFFIAKQSPPLFIRIGKRIFPWF
jgi:hypothetical protein